MPDERVEIEKVLKGFTLHPLPDGWTPLEAFVLIKSIDDEGDTAWSYRTTNKLNLEELLGVLSVHKERVLRDLLSAWDE